MKEELPDKCESPKQVSLWASYRLFICLIGCLVMSTSFASQTSMTSAMVCMIKGDATNSSISNRNNLTTHGNTSSMLSRSDDSDSWKFSWDSKTQGWVVSSFFIGYYVMQIPSGVIVTRVGHKQTLVASLMATGVLHILSVFAARYNLMLLCFTRALAGISCGCILSGVYGLAANWCPRQETSILFGLVGTGIEYGNAMSFIFSLVGCRLDWHGGWPLVFYILGIVQLILGLVLVLWVTNFPSTNGYVSKEEMKYIDHYRAHEESKSTRIPYKEIFCSLPVWAFIVSEFSMEWCYYTVVTQGPIFLRDILRLPHEKVNLTASIPFFVVIPIICFLGYLCDKVVAKGYKSNTTVRKLSNLIAKVATATPLIVLGFVPVGAFSYAFIAYLLMAIGFAGTYTGYVINPGDLSPAHAGFLAGLGQALTTWTGFVVPVFTGILTSEKTRESWQLVFYITGGILAFAFVFYLVFGSGELQPWARTQGSEADEETPIIKKK